MVTTPQEPDPEQEPLDPEPDRDPIPGEKQTPGAEEGQPEYEHESPGRVHGGEPT